MEKEFLVNDLSCKCILVGTLSRLSFDFSGSFLRRKRKQTKITENGYKSENSIILNFAQNSKFLVILNYSNHGPKRR